MRMAASMRQMRVKYKVRLGSQKATPVTKGILSRLQFEFPPVGPKPVVVRLSHRQSIVNLQ
jgi:hypothetical protein